MTQIDPIYIGKDATGQLLNTAAAKGLKRFAIIADTNTFKALGSHVQNALKSKGYDVSSIVLEGEEVHPNEHYLVEVLVKAPLGDCTFIAVGSGTITDTTRFISHRTGRSFIGMPTAPSVDGFTSIGAPLILGGIKTTIPCQPPTAVFADIDTLTHAPPELIAAGYGDMIGKITSLADWKIGSLLWEEPHDEAIAKRSQAAIDLAIRNVDAISQHTEEGIKFLMDALIESGLCILDFGTSRPASGAEHHASHYWEMKRIKEHGKTMLHGAQVGYALITVAAQYAKIRALSRTEAMDRLEAAVLPNRETEVANIRHGYGELADDVIKDHLAFLNMSEADFDAVKRRIADRWDEIQATAAKVPAPEVIASYLRKVGAPTSAEELGLAPEEVAPGFEYGHYLRNRFTVMKLSRILDVPLG